jgi:hypothetical protein
VRVAFVLFQEVSATANPNRGDLAQAKEGCPVPSGSRQCTFNRCFAVNCRSVKQRDCAVGFLHNHHQLSAAQNTQVYVEAVEGSGSGKVIEINAEG